MKVEGLSDKTVLVINQALNVAISIGIATYYFDGWKAFAYFFVSFAIMNAVDAGLDWVRAKFSKGG